MLKRIKKRFDIHVTASNAAFSKTFELDKTITSIHGILFTSDRDDLLYYRGTNKVEINKEEIFPEGYETKLLMTGINVSPNDRYYDLEGIVAGNGKVKIDYQDTPDGKTVFEPYRLTVYLDCEVIET